MSANTLSILLVFAVIAIGIIGYYLGRSVGREEGYSKGFIAGKNATVDELYTHTPIPKSGKEQVNFPKSNVRTKEHGPHGQQRAGGTWL